MATRTDGTPSNALDPLEPGDLVLPRTPPSLVRAVRGSIGIGLTRSVVLPLLALACAPPDQPESPVSAPMEVAFDERERVPLDTVVEATIGWPTAVLALEERMLVTDRMSNRVVAFARDGGFHAAIGGLGDGPGEFRNPASLVRDADGTILVGDFHARLTRVTENLELIEVVPVDAGIPHTARLHDVYGDLLLRDSEQREAGDNFVVWDREEGRSASFDPRSELVLTVPYWNATWTTHLTSSPHGILVADNMVYPFRLYSRDRVFIDTVGRAPPSWRQARKPERGEFAMTAAGVQPGADEWFRSFTLIDGLFTIAEEWLVVTHRDRVNAYRTDDEVRADVYQLPEMRKIWEDIELPGPVLAGGECAWTVVTEPPEPWTLACLVPRNRASQVETWE